MTKRKRVNDGPTVFVHLSEEQMKTLNRLVAERQSRETTRTVSRSEIVRELIVEAGRKP